MLCVGLFHAIRCLLAIFCAVAAVIAGSVAAAEDAVPNVSFQNDVMPVITKAGCNAGVCHAKAGGGQNGFELSLLGFEAEDDYNHIVRDARGRRVFPVNPDQSLLLRKASGAIPHGGGVRLPADSSGYGVLKEWIRQGARPSLETEPTLTSVAVSPDHAVLPMKSQQQLTVTATYSDGNTRDVTEVALFETNLEAMADVDESGLVTVHDIPGNVAVMIRLQGRVTVFTAAVPLGADVGNLPEPANFVDELVFENLKEIGVPPSPVCNDATFLRRVSLDITGRLPTPAETQSFVADTSPDKRDAVIERLLAGPGYADYFANKWTTLLKNRRDDAVDIISNFAFHAWVRDSLLANMPYDQLVRELLAATGTVVGNPPVAWYKRVKEPKEQLEDVSQLFLGVRLQCAQCHHHPFERWSQNDYYSLAAFFSQVGRKPTDTRGEDLIFHRRGVASAVNMRTGEHVLPAAFGDDVGAIPAGEDPRLRLADWMAKPDNPFFAKAVVNRYWKHFLGRGLIEPEDDIRDTNPPSNPKLLAALEQHFIRSGFDLKELVRVITRSKTYQLSSEPNAHNLVDRQNYSRFYPRRLQAEVLLDALDDLAGVRTTFSNLPPGTRAVALPDNSYNNASAFLRVFGRPDNTSVCECERVQSSSLAQSLHLINSNEMKSKLAAGNGTASRLSTADLSPADKVRELYRIAFSREPAQQELDVAVAYLNEPITRPDGSAVDDTTAVRQNLQDLIWSLMNSKEFLFNH